MSNNYKGNDLVRWLVIIADFAILNIVLILYSVYANKLVPEYFDTATKITFFVANSSLLLSQYFYSTIIHIRKIGFLQVLKRTFLLAFTTTLFFFIFIRAVSNGGGKMFGFSIIFGVSFYLVLIIARFMELQLLKYYRARG